MAIDLVYNYIEAKKVYLPQTDQQHYTFLKEVGTYIYIMYIGTFSWGMTRHDQIRSSGIICSGCPAAPGLSRVAKRALASLAADNRRIVPASNIQ